MINLQVCKSLTKPTEKEPFVVKVSLQVFSSPSKVKRTLKIFELFMAQVFICSLFSSSLLIGGDLKSLLDLGTSLKDFYPFLVH